jgi:hypothetical protein
MIVVAYTVHSGVSAVEADRLVRQATTLSHDSRTSWWWNNSNDAVLVEYGVMVNCYQGLGTIVYLYDAMELSIRVGDKTVVDWSIVSNDFNPAELQVVRFRFWSPCDMMLRSGASCIQGSGITAELRWLWLDILKSDIGHATSGFQVFKRLNIGAFAFFIRDFLEFRRSFHIFGRQDLPIRQSAQTTCRVEGWGYIVVLYYNIWDLKVV